MNRVRRFAHLLALTALLSVALLALAPGAMAATGTGLAGPVSDKTITYFCLGVILFFPILVTVLSTLQGMMNARKDRRRSDLERLS